MSTTTTRPKSGLLSRLLPGLSLRSRVMITAFIGTHIPLLALIVLLLRYGDSLPKGVVFLTALIATLSGTAVLLYTLNYLLRPAILATDALRAYLSSRTIQTLPVDVEDELGGLLRELNITLSDVETRRSKLETLAYSDRLTNLLNRPLMEEQLRRMTALARDGRTLLCLVLISVAGEDSQRDTQLQQLASALPPLLKRTSGVAARWAENVLLIALLTDEMGGRGIAEELVGTQGAGLRTVSVQYVAGEEMQGYVARAEAALQGA